MPYLNMDEGVVVLKKGHTLVLRDGNKKSLEFTVTHLSIGEDDEGEEAEIDENDGKCISEMRRIESIEKHI